MDMPHTIRLRIAEFLKQGLTPHDLSLTLALGITLGIFPVVGLTSILCTVASLVLRLNIVALQSVNWVMSPVQVLLLIPFIHLGGWLFGTPVITQNIYEFEHLLGATFWGTIVHFMTALLSAIGFWAIIAPPLGIGIYVMFLPIFSRIRFAAAAQSAASPEVSELNHDCAKG